MTYEEMDRIIIIEKLQLIMKQTYKSWKMLENSVSIIWICDKTTVEFAIQKWQETRNVYNLNRVI